MKKVDLWRHYKLIKIFGYLYKKGSSRVTDVSKKLNITYSHTSNLLGLLKKLDYVDRKNKGRETFYHLTNIGNYIGKRIYEIQEIIK